MATYWMRFGFGDPRTYTGLAPTFLYFENQSGQTLTPPSITETYAGTGVYQFTWGTTTAIAFLADAATTSPGTQGRYVSGTLDAADNAGAAFSTLVALGTTSVALGTTNVALGTTNVAIGTTVLATVNAISSTFSVIVAGIGSTASSYGTQSVAPVDLFGFLKRVIENLEGDQTYYKVSGVLDIFAHGTSTLLREKTVSNSVSLVIKSGS